VDHRFGGGGDRDQAVPLRGAGPFGGVAGVEGVGVGAGVGDHLPVAPLVDPPGEAGIQFAALRGGQVGGLPDHEQGAGLGQGPAGHRGQGVGQVVGQGTGRGEPARPAPGRLAAGESDLAGQATALPPGGYPARPFGVAAGGLKGGGLADLRTGARRFQFLQHPEPGDVLRLGHPGRARGQADHEPGELRRRHLGASHPRHQRVPAVLDHAPNLTRRTDNIPHAGVRGLELRNPPR